MARKARPLTERRIAEAALISFIRRGYTRTRISDIAGRAGVSVGTIYLYATDKEALFERAVRLAFEDRDAIAGPFPWKRTIEAGWVEDIWQRLMRADPLAELRRAAGSSEPADAGEELDSILRGLYRWQVRHWRALRLIEACASEWPELFMLFYKQFRREALECAANYMERRTASDHFTGFPDSRVAARVVMEVFAFFTMHVHTAPDSEELASLPVEETVIAMLKQAFLREDASIGRASGINRESGG